VLLYVSRLLKHTYSGYDLVNFVCFACRKLTVSCVDVLSCRHAAIAKYFGDPTPLCNSSCDYCRNPAAVTRLAADAKIGTGPSSNPKRHRVSRLSLSILFFLVVYCRNISVPQNTSVLF